MYMHDIIFLSYVNKTVLSYVNKTEFHIDPIIVYIYFKDIFEIQ